MSLDPVSIGHESESAPDFERAVLDRFAAEVGCDVAFLSMLGAEATPTVHGFDAATIERAVAGNATYAAELEPVKRAAFARRGVAVDTEVLGWERVQRAKYYREVAAPLGGRHSLLAYLTWRRQPIGMLMLGRTGRTARAFSASEIERVEATLPALSATRAAFGLPVACTPLPAATASVMQRLGLQGERILAKRDTAAGTLTVRDCSGFREMVATRDGRELVWTRAALSDPAVSGWPYIELFHVAAARAKERTRALFIGCGGAVAVRQFARMYPGIRIDIVDCDAEVIALALEHFALDAIPNVNIHIADGADYIERAPNACWDIVVLDAYDASDMGVAFSTRAFFATLARVLRPGGAAALNVIGTLTGPGPFERTHRALATELADVRIHPVTTVGERLAGDTLRNIVITAVRPRRD